MSQPRIGDHGLIGDLHSVALVAKDGSIDFACLPRFDSPSVFASLLDAERGGRFAIAPETGPTRCQQMYLPDSNVLLTRFLSSSAVVEISDFMSIHEKGPHVHDIVRRVKTIRGEARLRMRCQPAFDYARAEHDVEQREGEVLFASRGSDGLALRLRSDVPMRTESGSALAEFSLRAGETAAFVLEQASEDEQSPSAGPDYVPNAFKHTVNFWRRWLARSTYQGRWREAVHRSALTLKLLTFRPSGSIVAAPTFGLPEEIGGSRNWDYRYTWIRDSTFTLYALIRLGFTEEAGAFLDWIEARCRELDREGSLHVLYGLDGRTDLREQVLSHLGGHRQSTPVRIGNGAHDQLQLDVYGELMDAVYLYDKHGTQISVDLWNSLARLIDRVCENWRQPDHGIWESRAGRHEFLYSRVMCWVAIDRAVRLARKRALPGPLERWIRERDAIHRDVIEGFWDADEEALMQYKGASTVDAATLLLPLIKFIGPRDPRWLGTLRSIGERLVEDSLVYRYRATRFDDGLAGHEGTFTACTFWYVEAVARAGDLRRARFVFEKALGYANHLGLYAEEIGPDGEQLGNFPQALTHLALISAAYDLDRRLDAGSDRDV